MAEPDYHSSEAVFQCLFAFDCSGSCDEELIPILMKELKMPKQKAISLFQQALLIWEQHEPLDRVMATHSHDYDFDRIGTVEKGILRFALFTLQDKEQKVTVVMKEAMRLAKKFSTPHSAKYINAILDAACSATPSN